MYNLVRIFGSRFVQALARSSFFLLGLALAAAAGVDLLGVPLEQVPRLEDSAAEVAGVLRGHVDGVNVSEQVPLVRRLERAVGAPEDALVVAAVEVDRVAVHANLCNIGRGTLKRFSAFSTTTTTAAAVMPARKEKRRRRRR